MCSFPKKLQRISAMSFLPNGKQRNRALTSWFNGCRDQRLSLSDSLHGLFNLLIGGVRLQPRVQGQSGRQWIQSERAIKYSVFSQKNILANWTAYPGWRLCCFLLGVHGLHELQEVCRKSLKTIKGIFSFQVNFVLTCCYFIHDSSAHLRVHVRSSHSHGSHLLHVRSSKTSEWRRSHLK